MENCASYHNFPDGDGIQSQANSLLFSISLTTERIQTILANNFVNTTITPYNHNIITTTNNKNDYNGSEMDIHGSDLDPILNWKTLSNEEENGMAISVYIGIHVVIGLIGVVFNGW